MNKLSLLIILATSAGLAGLCSAQTSRSASSPATSTTTTTSMTSAGGSTAPYSEGPVWEVTMVRTKTGMADDYLKNLAGAYKSTSEEMKKQGIIMDYKILLGDAANKQDYDLLLLVEYKNMAALDNLRAKTDPIERKLIGTEEQMREATTKRGEIREILGSKLLREITLK